MKSLRRPLAAHPISVPAVNGFYRSHSQTVLARCLTPFCAAAVLCMTALQAGADTEIYLYDSNGNPVNVTATDSIQTNHIYDDGILIGTVNGSAQIVNASNEVIGYIQLDDGGE